jgi:Fic family protein
MDLNAYQAGEYEAQYKYQSFLPVKISHEWIISDPKIQQLLGQADRSLGELNAFAQLIPNIDFFIRMYVAKEATQSSRIEGTQTNIEDAFKVADDILPEAKDDWAEVRNYIEAIQFSIERLNTIPLSNRLLKETHKILMQGGRGKNKQPGEFRVSQNWIGVSLDNAVFVPPHYDHVASLMGDIENFLQDEKIILSPLIKIAIAHYQFETIHPFLDGNGRLGRLMISLYLASEELLVQPALYLSDYFERHKTAYIDHLMAVRQGHHMKEWLVFFLYGIKEMAASSIAVFKKIIAMKERIEREILPRFSSRRQDNVQKLMHFLYQQPIVNVKTVADKLNITTNTASALVKDFVEYGILKEITLQRRNRLFDFQEYFDLFKGLDDNRT